VTSRGAVSTRRWLRAGVIVAVGLLVGFTFPMAATVLGLVVVLTAVWRSPGRLAEAGPYLLAGALLVLAGPAIAVVTPSHETTELDLGPVQCVAQC
jgi:hypothetical protein